MTPFSYATPKTWRVLTIKGTLHRVTLSNSIYGTIKSRENRFDQAYMESILAPDFFEFGRSGKTYTREQSLSAPMQDINAKLPLENLQFHSVAENVVLVTYVSRVQYETVEVGNRSSLWVKTDSGWKLRFHQGTPTEL